MQRLRANRFCGLRPYQSPNSKLDAGPYGGSARTEAKAVACCIAHSCLLYSISVCWCRCAAAGIVRAVAATGGPGLWADSGYRFDEAVRNSMALLEDMNDAVRDAFAVALGELAAACKSGAAQDAVRASQNNCLR